MAKFSRHGSEMGVFSDSTKNGGGNMKTSWLGNKGNVSGLLRMGERYRDGDGVPKDLAKARDYLTKAAAADELSKLDQNTAVTKPWHGTGHAGGKL